MNIILFNNKLQSSFEYNEAVECAKHFEKVFVLLEANTSAVPQLPSNVITDAKTLDIKKSWKVFLFFNFFSVFAVWLHEPNDSHRKKSLKQGMHVLSIAKQRAFAIKNFLKRNQLTSENTIISSFWFYDVSALAWLRKLGWKGRLVCRAHGGDIYEERGSLNTKALFRSFEFKALDWVFSVSNAGMNYLRNQYPDYKEKVHTLFLGTRENGLAPFNKSPLLRIVTCARIRNVKRLYLLAELLYFADFPVKWTHIGGIHEDDPTYPRHHKALKKLNENPFVEIEEIGDISNEKVYAYYINNVVDLFVSVSENEGLPVSMMEAISYGIPVLATDVGGCKEIVNQQTGILIPAAFTQDVVLNILKDFKNSERNSAEFRNGVRDFWKANFDIINNYQTYYQKLFKYN